MISRSQAIALPSRIGLTALWRRFRRADIPVLFLHGVLPDGLSRPFNSSGKFISPGLLRRHLEPLGRRYRFVSLDDYLDHMRGRRSIENSILLTFDDGYANNYEYALPLLSGMGIPFAVFVTTGFVDTERVLWTDQLEYAITTSRQPVLHCCLAEGDIAIATPDEKAAAIVRLKTLLKRRRIAEVQDLVKGISHCLQVGDDAPALEAVRFLSSKQIRAMHERGVGLGSHTVNHAILANESVEDVRSEAVSSRARLESITGAPVRCFAYPNGKQSDFNAKVKLILEEAGYIAALATLGGISRPGDDLFAICRYPMDSRFSFAELETRISGMVEVLKGLR